jgi:hypothetical protein
MRTVKFIVDIMSIMFIISVVIVGYTVAHLPPLPNHKITPYFLPYIGNLLLATFGAFWLSFRYAATLVSINRRLHLFPNFASFQIFIIFFMFFLVWLFKRFVGG